MKNIYIRPTMLVRRISNESLLESESGQIDYGFSKENNFSSWDYDFDEEDNSESNSSSKSLWD
mgnify:CR=1 FL=1